MSQQRNKRNTATESPANATQEMSSENRENLEYVNNLKKLKPQGEHDQKSMISPNHHLSITVIIMMSQLLIVIVWVFSPDQKNVDNSLKQFENLCKENKIELSGCFTELLKVDFVAKVEKLTTLADEAKSNATAALSVANEAKSTADDIKSKMKSVRATADTANSTANGADIKSAKALTVAGDAKSESRDAKETASKAKATAESVDAKANKALETAQGAETTAGAAQSTADKIERKADDAQETANSAREKANGAFSKSAIAEKTANDALNEAKTSHTKAVNAENTADNALSNSNDAQNKAGDALNEAKTASNTAGAAQTLADKVRTTAFNALGTAKANEQQLSDQNQTSLTRYVEFKSFQASIESKQEKSHVKMSVSEELIDQMRNKELIYDVGICLSVLSILCTVMLLFLILKKGYIKQDKTPRAVQGRTASPRPIDQEEQYMLKWQDPMDNSVCVVAFHSETERRHLQETRSVFESAGEKPPQIQSRVVRKHSDIEDLPGSKVFLVFVDYNERNVILEDPAKGLGNLRVTTVRSLWKFGADVTLLYCKDQGSRHLDTDLFNRDLSSIFSHPELSNLKSQERMLSIFDGLSDRQKKHCRDVINRQLKRA